MLSTHLWICFNLFFKAAFSALIFRFVTDSNSRALLTMLP